MVMGDIYTINQVFIVINNDFNSYFKLQKSYKKKIVLYLAFLIVIIIYFLSVESVIARHKCPKVPAPPGVMGILSSTTLIPSGSTMAAARSSETSGCDRWHPSKNFYTPKKKRLTMFIKENFNQVSQESAQGHGLHLDALVNLSGCKIDDNDFGKIMQKNYFKLFTSHQISEFQEFTKSKVDLVSERILGLMTNSPLLSSRCNSG